MAELRGKTKGQGREKVPHLDGQYTAFGRTADADSLAVVKKIGAVQTGAQDRPVKPVTINKATVVEKPMA